MKLISWSGQLYPGPSYICFCWEIIYPFEVALKVARSALLCRLDSSMKLYMLMILEIWWGYWECWAYQFILPHTCKQARVTNILSGNYCQQNCVEPWVEAKFEDKKQGKVQVVPLPLIQLTNKTNATIDKIGSPEKLIASVSPVITGNMFDPDKLIEASVEKLSNQRVSFHSLVLVTVAHL